MSADHAELLADASVSFRVAAGRSFSSGPRDTGSSDAEAKDVWSLLSKDVKAEEEVKEESDADADVKVKAEKEESDEDKQESTVRTLRTREACERVRPRVSLKTRADVQQEREGSASSSYRYYDDKMRAWAAVEAETLQKMRKRSRSDPSSGSEDAIALKNIREKRIRARRH